MSPYLADDKTVLTPLEREGLSFLARARTHLRSGQTYQLETEECRWISRFLVEAMDERYGPFGIEAAA